LALRAGKDRQVEKAERLFQIMQESEFNYPATAWSYTALLSAYERSEKTEKFDALLEEMEKAGRQNDNCVPTGVTWFTVISMYEKTGRWEKALKLFEDVLKHGEDYSSCWFGASLPSGPLHGTHILVCYSYMRQCHFPHVICTALLTPPRILDSVCLTTAKFGDPHQVCLYKCLKHVYLHDFPSKPVFNQCTLQLSELEHSLLQALLNNA
jgi:pentatricopeptide repeat protein